MKSEYITHGTSHSVSSVTAFNYYSAQGYFYTRKDIQCKIDDGEILLINEKEGRYLIQSPKAV